MDAVKKVMILGGGHYQVPLIKAAKRIGYYSVVCGIKGDYPGYAIADKWVDVDTFDKEACLRIATEEKIDGVLVCGTDAVMPTVGYIVDNLHLVGPSFKSTILASNKAEMKAAFIKNGVRTAAYEKISSLGEALTFSDSHSFPVVLKVVDASGSRGVEIIQSRAELIDRFDKVSEMTQKDYLIIEEYVKGLEFGAQAFVRNGELTFVMPHGDIVFHSHTDVPIGHYAPFDFADELTLDITEQLYRCIKALGIDNTAINADFILKDGNVYVLEIGARAGATCLPELVSLHYGIDYYEYLLRICVGRHISIKLSHKTPALVQTLYSAVSGVIESINIKILPQEVVSVEIYPHIGEYVNSFRNAYDRIGTMTLRGQNIHDLLDIANNLRLSVVKVKDIG